MVDVRGYGSDIMDPLKSDSNLDSFLDPDFNFMMMDMSMDIAPTLITLYDSVAASSGLPEQQPIQSQLAQTQQACVSRDQEEPIADVPTSTTAVAMHPREAVGSVAASDDVILASEGGKCSRGSTVGEGSSQKVELAVAEEDGPSLLSQMPANQSFLHAAGSRVPLVDGACIDSYLDRTREEERDDARNGDGDSSANSKNLEMLTHSQENGNLIYGAHDANFNVEHSDDIMVSSDSPENMAIDVDFNSNSNNDCRPRAQSADLLSDSRRWSQRQRPASVEILSTDYLSDGGSSPAPRDEESHQTHTPVRQKSSRINPPIIVTTTPMMHEAMSPPTSPPTSPPMSPTFIRRPKSSFPMQGLTYLDRIVDEVIETERSYVRDLGDIIKGYQRAMKSNPNIPLTKEKFDTLFCNLEDIFSFNRTLLADLEQCDDDPVKLAECFLDLEDEFCIYTRYCTNYPKAVDVMTECMKDPIISHFFKQQQAQLNHGLALGAYLLKPVQRILKYHLLFQDMMKHYKEEQGRPVIARALKSMTNVAWHINDMKRKHEASVHVQEIQSQLHGWQDDLNTYGDLVLEGVMRMQGARGDRFIYLFEKALLIGKKHENTNLISIKTQITCSNLMLIESIPKEPLGFNVIPFDNADLQYTIIAKTLEQKKQWTHEIKRLILENYESNIPTKVKELILGTRAANDVENEKPSSSPQQQDPGMSRDRKERKSRKKHKRRNSEPMGKLQRGQKQVKGMKRPDLSRLGGKKSTDIQDDGTEDSLDEIESTKTRKSDPITSAEKGETSNAAEPLGMTDEQDDKELLSHEGGKEESPRSSMKKLVVTKNLGDKKEANRDSGIGSMTLSEHLKLDSEDKSSADEAKAGDKGLSKKKHGAVRKRENGIQKQDGLDDTEEDEAGETKDVVKAGGESPDELEALENLSDDALLDRDPLLDIDVSPRPVRKNRPMHSGSEPFKLRRVDLKEYRPLNVRISKDHEDVWVRMPDRPFGRNRSFSHIPSRPRSADIMHPHFAKMRLSRTRSDDSSLHTWAELSTKCRSDPNITDLKSDLGDSIESGGDEQRALGSSASTFGTVDGDLSSLSSHENLTESINNAFQKLGAKYAAKSESESGTSTPHTGLDEANDSSVSVKTVHNKTSSVEPQKEDTDSSSKLKSDETYSSSKDDDTSRDSPVEDGETSSKKKVQRLARKYSKMIKQQKSTIIVAKTSDPNTDTDGKQVAWAVTQEGHGATVIQRIEIDNSQSVATVTASDSISSRSRSTDSEDDKSKGSPFSRSPKNRRSVRDFVRKFEVPKSPRHEAKAATPVQTGIQERLRSFQQENKEPSRSNQQHRSSMGFKTLSERRRELEEWVAKPKTRSRHSSESKDSTDGLSCSSSTSDAGDLSFSYGSYQGSYASSRHSSGRSSPCPEARVANINAIKEGLLESISRLRSNSSTTDEEVTPAMFKSIRERFEELEKAAHKPIPKTVTDPKGEIKSLAESISDEMAQDELSLASSDKVKKDDMTMLELELLSVPFPEVFETSSSENSNTGFKQTLSDSLNTHLDAIDIPSDASVPDINLTESSLASDASVSEPEKMNMPLVSVPSSASATTVSITKTKPSEDTHQVCLQIDLNFPSSSSSSSSSRPKPLHPSTLDVLSLYEGLSEEGSSVKEPTLLSPEEPSALNRSMSSESSYKDAISEKQTSSSTPTSDEYITPEEH